MIKSDRIFLFALIAISTVWIACEKERDPCLQLLVNPLRFGVYQPADTGSLGRDSVLPAVALGIADSSVGWIYGVKSGKFSIILSPVADSIKWYIIPDTAGRNKPDGVDYVTFHYERKLHFISTGCGYTYYYNLTDVTSTNNQIDSIKIINSAVTNDAKIEHVKIFY